MTLIDTSVLIDYLKNKPTETVQQLDFIIENDIPFGICHFVYQELLQGAKTEKEFQILKEYFQNIPFYDLKFGKQSFERASLLNFKCRRAGITVRSTIDLLITEIAIENDLQLLHSDKDFNFIASVITELKIYNPSAD